MPDYFVPLVSRRREVAALIQKLQHVVPAAALLMQGLARLRGEAHGWSFALGAAELLISVVVVGAFVRQIVATRRAGQQADTGHDHGHGIDWVDVFLGCMLGVEVWAHWYESGHIKRPTVLLAVAMVVIGLLHGKIAAFGSRRSGLRLHDTGIEAGGRPFRRRFRATWDELAGVDIEPDVARLRRRDGVVREINLRDLRNAAVVREALQGVQLRLPVDVPPNGADASARS